MGKTRSKTKKGGSIMSWGIIQTLAPHILRFDGCIVELGAGVSSYMLDQFAVKYGRTHYTCDIRNHNIPDAPYSKYHKLYFMPSFEFEDQFDDEPILVFIDANHDYDYVKRDFEFFYDKLLPGGFIFMHDTLPKTENHLAHGACSDAYRLRRELEANPDIECLTWHHEICHYGLTMVTKKYRHEGYRPPV